MSGGKDLARSRTVIITGTSSGIGQAAAVAFAEKGWNVAATSRGGGLAGLEKFPNVKACALDVTDPRAIAEVFTAVAKDFGTIDAVVNNAGYGVEAPFETMTDAEIRKLFDTNVFGLMDVTRQAITHMRGNGGGSIVQVASMGGRLSFPAYSVYHSSKWAVEGFSESLRFELRQFGIRVKIVEPGVIATEFYAADKHPAGHEAAKSALATGSKNASGRQNGGYESFSRRVRDVTNSSSRRGVPASRVAAAIVKAAEDDSATLRYPVGSPAPLLLALRKLLPERVFLYAIARNFKLK